MSVCDATAPAVGITLVTVRNGESGVTTNDPTAAQMAAMKSGQYRLKAGPRPRSSMVRVGARLSGLGSSVDERPPVLHAHTEALTSPPQVGKVLGRDPRHSLNKVETEVLKSYLAFTNANELTVAGDPWTR